MMKKDIVISMCGHDKGRIYALLYEEDGYVYLADGKTKTLQKPKKKKLKHIKNTGLSIELKYNPLYDAHILKEIKSLLKKGGCCLG